MKKFKETAERIAVFAFFAITCLAFVLLFVSASAIESASIIPIIVFVVCVAWLGFVGYIVNKLINN